MPGGLIVQDTDRYGRLVGDVLLPDGRSLNQELVKAGMAWWYRPYAPNDITLAQLEADARTAKRGLWADAYPIPPWQWWHGDREPARTGTPVVSATPSMAISSPSTPLATVGYGGASAADHTWYGPLVEHFVSPCQAKPLVDSKVEADKTAVRTVLDAG